MLIEVKLVYTINDLLVNYVYPVTHLYELGGYDRPVLSSDAPIERRGEGLALRNIGIIECTFVGWSGDDVAAVDREFAKNGWTDADTITLLAIKIHRSDVFVHFNPLFARTLKREVHPARKRQGSKPYDRPIGSFLIACVREGVWTFDVAHLDTQQSMDMDPKYRDWVMSQTWSNYYLVNLP